MSILGSSQSLSIQPSNNSGGGVGEIAYHKDQWSRAEQQEQWRRNVYIL